MLTELLLLAGAGFLGKKALENPDKAKAVAGKFMDNAMKETTKRYKNGSISEADYYGFKENYSKIQGLAGEWQIKDQMNDFKKETSYKEDSPEYANKMKQLYSERNSYDERIAREQEEIERRKEL
ncbi:MAG: hypothetical protein K6G33_07260 [Ruminococcus sp.]|uniref:hypothetical protein n=1 Tax=Ruminococcus sp. TaxID=41978 RepID=UPI0025FF4BEA|nr:hypothetical protein [Ruminococcus sp.]MCR5600520.1 hypothetical protein [Ruminococcus sp.]